MKQAFTSSPGRIRVFHFKTYGLLKLCLLLSLSFLLRENLQAQSFVQVPATGGIPSPSPSSPTFFPYGFGSSLNVRAALLYRPSEMINYPVAFPIEHIGFKLAGPASGLPWGPYVLFKIYVIPTTDTSYNLSSNWATLVNPTSGAIQVYDGGFLIPLSGSPPVTGYFDFVLKTPFKLPPNQGFYLAYDAENTLTSVVHLPFEIDTTLANGYHAGYGNSHSPQTAPSTLPFYNNYRHVLRLGYSGGTTGIGETRSANSILVYPNPAREILHIDLGKPGRSEIQATLRDLSGKIIRTKNLLSNPNQIALHGISPGIYSLHLTSGSETFVKRIVVE